MERKDFLMEAALRLIAAKPAASMWEIHLFANELTEQIFGAEQDPEADSKRWWSDEVDTAPANILISHIEKSWRSFGYGVRLTRIFAENNIKTVGDLLRIGRHAFRDIRHIGGGATSRIDDALDELYGIMNW